MEFQVLWFERILPVVFTCYRHAEVAWGVWNVGTFRKCVLIDLVYRGYLTCLSSMEIMWMRNFCDIDKSHRLRLVG